MSPHEEQLQNNIERGLAGAGGDEIDSKAYREIFRALKKDPGYELPSHFAESIVEKVVAKQKKEQSTDYFWFFSGVFVLLIAAVSTIALTGFRLDFGFLKSMADYKGLAVFGLLFIVFLNWLDKRLVRERLMHH